MLAEDVAPNRLERAKAEIRDLLELLDGDQVGLVAFAGRASIVAPLTPDFGFVRLALDDTGPHSVTRGGTRLEEPIRKAVAGFGDAGEVSRSILLITDGEDHDSFPMQAAREAAERGIPILAIGFGAEGGAEIPITDPGTAARTLLRDADGAVIRSRLDGELLREMALATGGAYIPAGTGVLDLESIYRRHIAPLTRGRLDARARAVRNDAFQWAVMMALLALLGAVMSTARRPARSVGRGAGTAAVVVALAVSASLEVASNAVLAQPLPDKPVKDTTDQAAAEVPDDPREAYNEGVAKLEAGDAENAARLLEAARSQAGLDRETRFRATYNLGWAEVRAADPLTESAPTEALERLDRAAAWFREAVDFRPAHDDARYNLDVVMRRALELADSIAARDAQDLLGRVNAVLERQREFLAALREGVEAQPATVEANVTPDLRRLFRALAARELTVLSDAEQLSGRAVSEAEAIRSKPDEERSPEDSIRAARLEAVVGHLHRARERIAQARTRLRRMQGERGYRRATAALDAFRRARDQLLDPVARLDALLADGMEVAQLTGLKAVLERGIDSLRGPVSAPDWLTRKYLAEAQVRLESRTDELHAELASGLAAHDSAAVANAGQPDQPGGFEPTTLVARLRAATPMIGEARRGFEAAANALSAERFDEALEAQREALESLAAAREHFLDLRRLVELVYGEQRRVAELIADDTSRDQPGAANVPNPEPPSPGSSRTSGADAVTLGATLHERNVERAVRLGRMLSDAAVEARGPQEGASAVAPARGQDDRLERGYELLRRAMESMHAASRTFARIHPTPARESARGSALAQTRSSVGTALGHLEELRRLFFTVLEHLRETAQRQQQVADDTEALAALADPADRVSIAAKAGPLAHRQGRLVATTNAIGEALHTQASAPPAQGGVEKVPAAGLDPERLVRAAELVSTAGDTMGGAVERLGAAPPALERAREAQDAALGLLLEAVALLQPPGSAPPSGDEPQQPEQTDAGDEGEPPRKAEEASGETDLGRLLQGVRNREARRREERARSQARQSYEPVEKDW